MPGYNNFQQWNPTQANQETDAQYSADTQRSGGAIAGVFPSPLANKLFYQPTTFVTAFAQMLAFAGATVSDASITALITTLQSYVALLQSPAFVGVPTAPSPTDLDRTTKLATMANFNQVDAIAVTSGSNSNGHWFKFPAVLGGIIVQMGSVSLAPNNVPLTSSFPTAFSVGCLGILISYQASTPPTAGAVGAEVVSTTQWKGSNSSSAGSNNCNWVAIGV
jgi:hypothetical protein